MATESTKETSGIAAELNLADLTPEQQRELLAQLLREKAEKAKVFPMSAGQQGLWHAFRRTPEATPFNVFLPTRIRSAIDIEVLRKAIELVARRHASLRTTFSDAQGKLTQRVHDDLKPEFAVVELPGADDATARRLISRETLRPFDLETGPLLRVTAYRIADDDWIILAVTHHIVVDFWSLILLLDELRTAYPSLLQGRTPSLPDATNNFRDFVQEQSTLLSHARGEALRRYWASAVEGIAPVVEIPTDRIRPAQFPGLAAVAPLDLPGSASRRITEFATRYRSTPFAVVHAALQVLIARYSGQNTFFIGSPFLGRAHQKFERTVGFFVNMLPLKADLAGAASFADLVGRTSQTLLDALEHQEYPISQIVQDAGVARDPSRSPLFQVSCTFEKAQLKEEMGRAGFLFPNERRVWDFGGLRQESFYIPHPTCHYDLEFIFEQGDSDLRGMICYSRDLFDADTIRQLAANFSSLLDSLLAQAPSTPVSHVPWRQTDRSTAQVGVRKRQASASSSGRTTVSAMLDHAAAMNPAGVALQSESQTLTYGELQSQSRKLANELAGLGVKPGDRVPIVASCCPAAFMAMLAVHRAGAAFVPVDAAQPTLHLPSLVADTQAPAVVADDTQRLADLETSLAVVSLGDHPFSAARADSALPGANPDDLAYVVYTSGSTGVPKGVMVDHAAVCNTLHWRMRAVPLEADDRVLMLLSHQFDAGLGIAWTTLSQGAALVWADAEAQRDPNQLVEQILRDRITVLPAVPSLLQVLIAHPKFAQCQTLRFIWTGGEAMPPELPQQLRSVSKAAFWNFYGPTEAAIEATACEVTHHDPRRPVPIGKAVDGAEILVLDEQHRPVPDTVPGELAIAGAGLARGYLNHDELTDEKFIAYPTAADPDARVYLTGDRGRINARGEVEFLGRTDHQIKLRGYRIELGEIESVLQSHYLVDRAAVKLIGEGAAAQLLAVVSLDRGTTTDPTIPGTPAQTEDDLVSMPDTQNANAAIRRFLAEQLPAYKRPAALMIVASMPLTSSGKVDRQRLPDALTAELLQQQMTAPSTPLEDFLAQAWCEILEREAISVHQNFFDAGGSSLQAALLTNKLSEELRVRIPTSLLFDLADVSQMATRLVELHAAEMTERFGADCVARQRELNPPTTPASLGAPHALVAPLNPSGSRSPLFMVHPPGGIVVCYRELARHLSGQQPLFGIRSRGLHGQEDLPNTLTEMAAEYVDAIRTTQPAGPYTVGGWSLGGLVAYEIAQQLLASGQSVTRVVLLDTTIPEGSTDRVPAEEQVNVGLEYGIDLTLDQLGELAPEEQLPFLWEHAKKLGVLDENSPPEVVAQALEDLQSLFHHHVRLSRTYLLQPLAAPVTLIRPMEVPFELQVAEDRGWGHLSDAVDVQFVPGHHHSMVQPPHVQHLAQVVLQTGGR